MEVCVEKRDKDHQRAGKQTVQEIIKPAGGIYLHQEMTGKSGAGGRGWKDS